MKELIIETNKYRYKYEECCSKLISEIQKYINWDSNFILNYLPNDGLCIVATLPHNLVIEYEMSEVICPVVKFYNFVKEKEKITAEEFKYPSSIILTSILYAA